MDNNFNTLVSPVPSALSTDLMGGYGWWGSPTPEAAADVTESACALSTISFRLPCRPE